MTAKKRKKSKKSSPLASQEFAAQSSYYKGIDIKKPFDAEIEKLEKVEFDDDSKWVLHLVDHDKGIVLNLTNGRILHQDLGDEMDEWPGQTVHIFTEKRRNPTSGKIGPCISVCGTDSSDEDDLPLDDDDID